MDVFNERRKVIVSSRKVFLYKIMFYLKKLSGEVIPVEISTPISVYRAAYAVLGVNPYYEIKLFADGELLPMDATVEQAELEKVMDVLYSMIPFYATMQYIDSPEMYNCMTDRYRVHVEHYNGEITTILRRMFFYEYEGRFTPDALGERFVLWFDTFEELVRHMVRSEQITEEVYERMVESIVKEWVPKHTEE